MEFFSQSFHAEENVHNIEIFVHSSYFLSVQMYIAYFLFIFKQKSLVNIAWTLLWSFDIGQMAIKLFSQFII